MLVYLKDIVESLYDRYPLSTIQQLKDLQSAPTTDQESKTRINYKVIYV